MFRANDATSSGISVSDDLLTIGEMCAEFGVTPRTLRFYEAKELISPVREGQKRLYTRRCRARLKLILSAPELLNNQVLERLQVEITRLVAGAVDVKAPPALVARSLVSVGFGAMLWWAEQNGKVSAEKAFDSALGSLSEVARSSASTSQR